MKRTELIICRGRERKRGGKAGWMVEKAQWRSRGRNTEQGSKAEEMARRGCLCLVLSFFARLPPSNLGVMMAVPTGRSPYTPVITYL